MPDCLVRITTLPTEYEHTKGPEKKNPKGTAHRGEGRKKKEKKFGPMKMPNARRCGQGLLVVFGRMLYDWVDLGRGST